MKIFRRKYLALPLALLLLMLAMTGCSPNVVGDQPTPVVITPTPSPPAIEDVSEVGTEGEVEFIHSFSNYGEPYVLISHDAPLYAYIRFPQAENRFDAPFRDWAQDVYDYFLVYAEDYAADDPEHTLEIHTTYQSTTLNEKYAGVGIIGWVQPDDEHRLPTSTVVMTFNMDLEEVFFLSNSDILSISDNTYELLFEQIIARSHNAIDMQSRTEFLEQITENDENWFKHIALGPEGVIVHLEPGVLLPEEYDIVSVPLPYDRLGDDFILWNNTPSDSSLSDQSPALGETPPPRETPPPLPDPTAPPDPTPTPDPIPIAAPQNSEIDYSKPMVALTFDDGPHANTKLLLDILEQYNVRATFCVIGQQVSDNASIIERAVSLGCEVIGHSWDHKNLSNLSESDIRWQLDTTNDAIVEITGVNTHLYRAPYGATNDTVKDVSRDAGYAIIFWSVDPLDWKSRDADSVYKEVMGVVKDKDIILSHDIYKSTVDAYARIIPELIRQGYQLVTVTELLANQGIEAGKTYSRG